MLERIAAGAPPGWTHAEEWARADAAAGRRPASGSSSTTRAAWSAPAPLLDLDPDRFVCVPNGFDPDFAPAARSTAAPTGAATWSSDPRAGARARRPAASPTQEADLAALDGTVLLYVGRFTEVKRLPLLIEAFAAARAGASTSPRRLVLVGGHPGEWEGEHPIETIERLGVARRLPRRLALPRRAPGFLNAADLPRPRLGPRAVRPGAGRGDGLRAAGDRGRPRRPGDDRRRPGHRLAGRPRRREALADAMVAAVNDPPAGGSAGSAPAARSSAATPGDQIGLDLAEIAGRLARVPI